MRDLIPQSLDRRSAAGTEGCTLLEKLFSYTKLTSRAPSSRFRIMHTLSRCQQRARNLEIEEQFVCNRLVTFAERVSITARALSSPLTAVMSILLFYCVVVVPAPHRPLAAPGVISYTSFAFFPLPLSTPAALGHSRWRTIRASLSVALLLSRGFASEIFFALAANIK